ncbi:MAG TPA: hypothetical protein PKW35_04095 [Nannocystaceae bacterium]|nr:hypothetical protein [Nannocystaceae bacterium]
MPHLTWPETPLSAAAPAIRPERALLTPTWLLSLAVLGVNDHVLKGAALLPGAITGKLSDFAGMLVAPALLAALTAVRSRRGLFLAHLAVGGVFAAINLSSGAASAWSALMGVVGFPWKITVDPTDLVALPALALSYRALAPAMTRPVPTATVRALERTVAAAGVAFSVATSPAEPFPEGEGWYDPIYADVYLHNATDNDLTVRVRELRDDVLLDCFEVAANPGQVLSEGLFATATTWNLPAQTTAPARDMNRNRECHAVVVELDGAPSSLLFWQDGAFAATWVDGQILDDAYPSDGAIRIDADTDGILHAVARDPSIQSELADPESPPAGACAPQTDAERLAWTTPPLGAQQILAIDVGVDGCLALDLSGGSASTAADWYVCLPPGLFPFEVGDWFAASADGDLLHVAQSDEFGTPILPARELHLATGDARPNLADTVISVRADYQCALAPDACGTVARTVSLSAKRGENATVGVAVGESVTLPWSGSDLTLHLVHGQERVVLDTACSEGPAMLGGDVELVAVLAPSAQP